MSQKKNTSSGINPNWTPDLISNRASDISYFVEGIKNGDRAILAEAITKIESSTTPIEFTLNLLKLISINDSKSGSIRIGISGSPGVGKSTFINSLGAYLVDQQFKVAVLAVDPSSELSKGSILGDKTRMQDLSLHPDAFVRPTPSNNTLGGVAQLTKESIDLCEAAGYEIILIETVGVGQSETQLKDLVDIFCLLLLPGAGDELQGIKKGIVEISDLFVINKADAERVNLANQSKKYYQNALHLQKENQSEWTKKVLICSALNKEGFEDFWEMVQGFIEISKKEGTFERRRKSQKEIWKQSIQSKIMYDGIRRMAQLKKIDQAEQDSIFDSLLNFKSSFDSMIKKLNH